MQSSANIGLDSITLTDDQSQSSQSLAEEKKFDAIIIGGGPAGTSCALWLKMLGYLPCIIEKRSSLGGLQNESPYPNQWIVVLPGLTGQQVAGSIQKSIVDQAIPFYLESTVTDVETTENGYRVKFENNTKTPSVFFAPNLVIASGVHPATGGLVQSDKLLIGPGKQIANYSFTGKEVAILGGGDSAFENYEFIKKKDPRSVHIYAQNDEQHSLKARYEFLARVPVEDVNLYQGTLALDAETGTVCGKHYDVIIALYGWTAYLPYLSHIKVDLDEKGFVATNPATAESSLPGVYAIGEVAHRHHPCCATAMADGVVAAKAIQNRFELAKKQSLLLFKSAKKLQTTSTEMLVCSQPRQ